MNTDDRVHNLEQETFGNGKKGLLGRTTDLERIMYDNPDTKEPGLASSVKEIRLFMQDIRRALSSIDWVLRWLGGTGTIILIAWFIRSII